MPRGILAFDQWCARVWRQSVAFGILRMRSLHGRLGTSQMSERYRDSRDPANLAIRWRDLLTKLDGVSGRQVL